MKVVSITMVKNEVDIIESFVRYHLNIVDEMIILDNCSSDETPVIITKLIDEGLPIIFITDSDSNYNQSFKMNLLMEKAFNEYGADIVCVLDVDEFLISCENTNPREILNNLDLDGYYLAKWITYIPTEKDSNDLFIPKRITHVRDENLESFFKVIVTKGIFNKYSPKLEMGNHNLSFPKSNNPPKNSQLPLKIAHFPIRSIEQCISKVSVGWPNLVSINTQNKSWGWHWRNIFEKIKSNKNIDFEDLENFAKYYALEDFSDEIKIITQPINLDFCNNIEIKYHFNYNYLRNILDGYEYSSKQLMSFKRLIKGNALTILNSDYEVIKNSKLFDEEWYRDTYGLEDDVNPIVHYLITWREDLNDPADFFSTEFYLKTHVDVDKAGMNPFVHYIRYGKNENRKISPSKLNDIKISIIIPVYNVENYLKQCLDSILSQDFDDFEVICVNDGSADNSLEILKNYAQKDSRVKVISQSNNGPGNARNIGLAHAKGEYVLFVDSDDYLSTNSLSQIYNNAKSNQSDLVLFDFYQWDKLNDKCDNLGCHLDTTFDKDFNNFTFTYREIKKHVLNSFFNCWFKFYKKSFLDKFNIVFPENIFYEDVLFHVKSILLAESISFLPNYFYNYRLSNQNSIMDDKSKIFDIIDVVDSVESFLKDNGFFEELEVEFYTFKIIQLSQYIRFWGDANYFSAVKKEFISMNDSSGFDFNRLAEPVKTIFDKILKSGDELEFMGIEHKYGAFSKAQVKVSCTMPVYNCEEFLEDSINSILNQSLGDLELICVDDGSTDNSLKILRDFEKKDSRVKVFALNHEGGGNARNFALKQVTGEYLYLMDADDVLDLNAFEDFYSISKSKNLDFLMFKAKLHDIETDEYSETDYYSMSRLSGFGGKVINFRDLGELIFYINVTPWCKFYNTEFIINSGAKFRENSKFHDNQFFWDIIFQSDRILFLDEFYYTHNIHSKSLIESGDKRHADSIYVYNDMIELFRKHNQLDTFKRNLFNNKVALNIIRYGEIRDEFKEFYFEELKKDFALRKCTDFRNNLSQINKFLFDCVLISKNCKDFSLLKEYSQTLANNQLSRNEKITNRTQWYNKLNEHYQQFFSPTGSNIYNYLISVIVPVFNGESYIENAFNSLLNQSIGFEKLEIIFVDDASTDNTLQIINDYAAKYENVIAVHLEENSEYAGRPRNVGMRYATSDYLMFLDCDDVYLNSACELLYDEISSNNLNIVSGVHCDGKEVPDYLWCNILTDPMYSLDNRLNQVNELVKDSSFELEVTSVDEYPSIIATANIWDKIFKKSLIENNEITFPEEIPGEDSVFLLNAFLNANGIKFINKVVLKHDYERSDSSQHQFSKTKILKRLQAYYQMYYLCAGKNKTDIFNHYLLVTKLRHVLVDHIMKSNLPTGDIFEILEWVKPLYKLYVGYCDTIPNDLAVFEDIAYGRYEEALKFIQGSDTPNLREVKCIVSSNFYVKDCVELSDDWQSQFESIKPDLFAYQDKNDDILNYCNANNIQTVQLDGNIADLKEILDSVNFKYIPDLKHLVVFYELGDLDDLTEIRNHFFSIKYPYKHLKLITDESNLFLSYTILKSDLNGIDLDDNYYFCFADLSLDPTKLEDNVLSKSEFKKAISDYNIKNPKISVIVPIYNTEYYLEETLDSIVNQTFFDSIEVILIDDGSTDRSREIMEKYVSRYKNVHGYYKDHMGVCAIRNFGIDVARGEYIHLMDSDDLILTDAYEKLYQCTQNGKYDVVTSNYVRLDGDDTFEIGIGEYVFSKSRKNIENTNLADYPELSWDMPLWNKIIKKEFLDENNIRFQDKCTIYSDNPFTIKVYIKAKQVFVLNDVAYCWRVRKVGTSITQDTDFQMPKSFYEMAKTVNDLLIENVCDKRVLNDKYQKLLKVDLFILINKINLNYPPESQDELFEVVLDTLNLIPDEYLNNSSSFFKMLCSIVKARDWDNLRLFTDFGVQFNLNLPESLDQKYVEMIDTKNDPLENNLGFQVNNVYLDENNIVFNFPRIVPVEDADYYENISFRMVSDDFEDATFGFTDNKLAIPLDSINFGENRLIIDYLFNSIKQSTHIKTSLKKTFVFDDFKILVDYGITKDLKLFKCHLNKNSMVIDDVSFLNDKIRFVGRLNGNLNEITFKDYLNCGKITAFITHENESDFSFEIDYSEFLKAPVKKWEIDARFTRELDCSYDKYHVLIKNSNGNGTITFELEGYGSDMLKPKISVVMPVYNSSKYLNQAIDSILNQTFSNFELICVDDASTDSSLEILESFAKNDSRVKILKNDSNKGPGNSRNKALDVSNGKYIFFADSDDWIEKETLEFLFNQCEKDELDVIMFKNIVFYENKNDFGHEEYYDMVYMDKYDGEIFNHWDLTSDEVFDLPVGPCNKLYKKSFLDKHSIRFPNQNVIQEDNPFFFKVITLAEKVGFSTKYLYNRRRWHDSIIGSLGDERLFGRIHVADLLVKYFLSDDKLYEHYKRNLFDYVSNHLTDEAHEFIKDDFKQEMHDCIHDLYIKFFDEYGLKEDILECVDEELLIKYGVIK
ncbi:MAG: glycosyltransferase [Methanobrevibacter sp.]|uniref:glycosyltransferase family 2 protein n=1 Tax=Methanobrevibacter sp. TaxID=66852 RepID=UPI002E75BC54|nr:glycosyltransferase [Methanobrevibacter sp.]MEE0942222.1 glycosyltransferase [Methanobrevibacter sp.]